jgi:aspartokinase-like uncharacterized kinase
MRSMERRIFAIGGGRTPEPVRAFCLALTGKERPKVLFVPTASGGDLAQTVRVYDAHSGLAASSSSPGRPTTCVSSSSTAT